VTEWEGKCALSSSHTHVSSNTFPSHHINSQTQQFQFADGHVDARVWACLAKYGGASTPGQSAYRSLACSVAGDAPPERSAAVVSIV